jgi:hypothetical protein
MSRYPEEVRYPMSESTELDLTNEEPVVAPTTTTSAAPTTATTVSPTTTTTQAPTITTTGPPAELDLTKTEPPPIGAPQPAFVGQEPIGPREKTRGQVAAVLLGILAFLVAGSFISLWFDWASSEELDTLLTILFAPIIGLVGAATGFYFGERAAEETSSAPPSSANTGGRRT